MNAVVSCLSAFHRDVRQSLPGDAQQMRREAVAWAPGPGIFLTLPQPPRVLLDNLPWLDFRVVRKRKRDPCEKGLLLLFVFA